MQRRHDVQPMPPSLIEKTTDRLDGLAKLTVKSAQHAEEVKQQLLDHLRNLQGQILPVKAFATQCNGGEGYKPYGTTDTENSGGWLAPDYYEIGEVQDWFDFGVQLTLHSGDMAFTVRPDRIEKVSDEDIRAHREQLDKPPQTDPQGY